MISVTSITRLDRPPTAKGVQHLAYCSIRLDGLLTIEGCLLVHHPAHGRRVWAPSMQGREVKVEHAVKFSQTLSKATAEAASQAYDALVATAKEPKRVVSAAVELVRQIEGREAA